MTVRVTCPNPDCGVVANVEEQSLGRKGRCKKCGHVFALARPDGEPASAISGDASAWKGSSSASPTNLPEQFGRYRIMKQLGQGGMGAVYLAHDTRLDRPVALKVPFFHPADGPQAIQRFEREARAAANLDHPNLCPIYDVGEVDGIHYLTMPYIEGKPLSEALARDQTFTEAQAAAVVRKLALALQEAHDKGVVHRDLKPGNIMVKKGRDLVIMDFGLARMVGGADGALTRTGHVLGTALYMAPEQAAGDTAATGPTCDVYALGVILHELLTGRRPFEGPWSLVIGLKNVKDPDPPSKYRAELSPILDAICLKAIAQKPGDRYKTMAELAEALGAFLARPSSSSPAVMPEGTPPATRNPESLATQVFAGLVSGETTSLREEKASSSPKPARPEGEAPRLPARMWIAAAGAVGALLLGITIYVATDNGRIKIKVNDPKAVVKVDGKEVLVEGLGEPISLRAGEHELSVKWGDGEFQTKKFVVRRGGNEDLIVGFEPKAGSTNDLSKQTPPGERPESQKSPASTAGKPDVERVPGTAVTWKGDPPYWTVQGNRIKGFRWVGVGQPHSYLYSEKSYKDFELKCRVLLKDGTGNSGIQIRSEVIDETKFLVRGPQVDIGGKYWGSLYGEDFPPQHGGMMEEAPADLVANIVKPNEFNDVVIRCVGKHVTVTLNGSTTINNDFPQMPGEGRIGWQLHSRAPVDITVEDLEITELITESKADGFRPLFNGKDLAGWKTHPSQPGNWRVKNGILIGSGQNASHLYTDRENYRDFHLLAEARINDGGNSGVYFRGPYGPVRPVNNPVWPDGYEAQINSTHWNQDKTGSLRAGKNHTPVAILRNSPVPSGQWFKLEIIANSNHIIAMINNKITADYFDNENLFTTGNIILQAFGIDRGVETVVEFRRIEIKELK